MTDYSSTQSPEPRGSAAGDEVTDYGTTRSTGVSESAAGGYVFAGIILIVVGCFQAIAGVAAIFEDEFYAVTPNYIFEVDTTTWGWIHLLLGLVVAFAGYALFAAKTWARVVGVTVAALSCDRELHLHSVLPVLGDPDHLAGHLGDLGTDAACFVGGRADEVAAG